MIMSGFFSVLSENVSTGEQAKRSGWRLPSTCRHLFAGLEVLVYSGFSVRTVF
jgi:hypothetical protein